MADSFNDRVLERIVIPDTFWGKPVTEISPIFCKYLGEPIAVDIGKNVEVIGYNSFSSCRKLKFFFGGEKVTDIGSEAFEFCYTLERIAFGENVEKIEDKAFG